VIGDVNTRERLLETLDMFDFGVELMLSNLRRRYPDALPTELELLLDDWLVKQTESAPEDQRVVTDRYR
jgi:hypothetical protein